MHVYMYVLISVLAQEVEYVCRLQLFHTLIALCVVIYRCASDTALFYCFHIWFSDVNICGTLLLSYRTFISNLYHYFF